MRDYDAEGACEAIVRHFALDSILARSQSRDWGALMFIYNERARLRSLPDLVDRAAAQMVSMPPADVAAFVDRLSHFLSALSRQCSRYSPP